MQGTQSYGNDAFLIDEGNFSHLFEKHYVPVVFFANRLMKNRERAEDIVCEAFISLWQKRNEFQTEKSAKAFLYITARNTCCSNDEPNRFALVEITRAEVLRKLFYEQQTHKP
jgi:RNA polymerase sigma factor (sigma-70 family)